MFPICLITGFVLGTVDGHIERLAAAVLLVGPTQGETAELLIDVKSAP